MIKTIKEYTSKRINLVKIEAIEKSSLSAGIITYFVILLVAFTFFIILFNFGIACLIGKAMNNYSYGFLIVATFYILVMAFVIAFKNKIVNTVADQVIKFLNH